MDESGLGPLLDFGPWSISVSEPLAKVLVKLVGSFILSLHKQGLGFRV